MTDNQPTPGALKHTVRPLADVPVYNCHVYVSPPQSNGKVFARAATLADVAAEGKNERDALRAIVANFKQVIGDCVSRGEPIPWLPQPLEPQTNESQRFVPVHF